ncbi:MAG: hypothetical protein K2O12_00300, partial [Muribaculaceae bacterium]|nr:hypothetical protein [Muribaculaceae bacterium]
SDAGGTGGPFTNGIFTYDTISPGERYARLCAIAGKQGRTDRILSWLQLPHSANSTERVVSGNAILAYGLSSLRFAGYRASHYMAERPAATGTPSRMAVSVHFTDGSASTVSYIDTETSTLRLNPMIAYPRADAVRMSFIFTWEGRPMKAEIPLNPSAANKWAYYLREDGKAFSLTDIAEPVDEFHVPASSSVYDDLGHYCSVSPVENPLRPTDAGVIGNDRIISAIDCSNSTSLVETPRFAIFTTGGMHRMSVSAADVPTIRSLRKTDCRILNKATATATDGSCVYAILSGDLVCFNGTKAKTLRRSVISPAEDVALGFSRTGELWISTPERLMVCIVDSLTFYDRSIPEDINTAPFYTAMTNADGELFGCCSQSGMMQMLSREQTCLNSFFWTECLRTEKGCCRTLRPSHIIVSATGNEMQMRITARLPSCPDSTDTAHIARIDIKGRLRTPLRYPLACGPTGRIRVTAEGHALSGTQIKSIELCV